MKLRPAVIAGAAAALGLIAGYLLGAKAYEAGADLNESLDRENDTIDATTVCAKLKAAIATNPDALN